MTRLEALAKMFGCQGGTIHDFCREMQCDVGTILYGEFSVYANPDVYEHFSLGEFAIYHATAAERSQLFQANKKKPDFWLGAIAATQNQALLNSRI